MITFGELWIRRSHILLAMICGFVVGVLCAVVQPPTYVATMSIASTGLADVDLPLSSSLPSGSISQVLRGLKGTGVSSADSDYSYFINLLNSDRVARQLLNDQTFVQHMFGKEWDTSSKTWHQQRSPVAWIWGLYNQVFFGISYTAPDPARVKDKLSRVFSVQFDIENDVNTLSMRDESCEAAVNSLTAVFQATDRVLKSEKRLRFDENIASLQKQLAKPENEPLRAELADAVVQQFLRRLSTESRLPLGVRVLDGPDCATRPILPLPFPYALAGAVIGVLSVLVSMYTAKYWPRKSAFKE